MLFERLEAGKRGKVGDLEEVLPLVLQHGALITEVVKCSAHKQASIASRAAWLLRKVAETDPALLAQHKRRLLNYLTQSPHWEVKTELCHILPHLPLTRAEVGVAIRFFEACQTDASRIVRAWSLNALYELSYSIPNLIPQVLHMVQAALDSDAPAIRARARNIMKAINAGQTSRKQKHAMQVS